MIALTRPAFAQLTASVVLGVPVGYLAGSMTTGTTGSIWAGALAIFGVVCVLWCANRLANRAAVRFGSSKLPWALWVAVTISFWVAIAALFEISAIFAANDFGDVSGPTTALMLGTGAIGVMSALGTAVISGMIAIRFWHTRNTVTLP